MSLYEQQQDSSSPAVYQACRYQCPRYTHLHQHIEANKHRLLRQTDLAIATVVGALPLQVPEMNVEGNIDRSHIRLISLSLVLLSAVH